MKTETVLNPSGNPVLNLRRDVDDFTRGYIIAALWTEEEQLGADKSWTDLAPETLQAMIDDCAKFQRDNAPLLAVAIYKQFGHTNAEYAGQDFWLTRNGHGAGFWDGDLPDEIGDALHEACKQIGETWIYLGDDGRIYSN